MSYFCKKNLILKKNISMKGQQTTENRQQTLSNDIAKNQYSLSESNTMGFDITAKHYYEINSLIDIEKIVEDNIFNNDNILILGGGSNILFQNEYYNGTVIHSNLKGIVISPDDEDSQQLSNSTTQNHIIVRCMSGEVWKDFVDFTVENNLYGLENLVDIPGSVGASPVQNIGAYGVEVKDCIDCVYTIDLTNGDRVIFNNEDCHFAYRDSIFKKEENKKYFIVAIDFKLKKNADLNLEYGNIKEYLERNNITTPTLSDVAKAIKTIRADKLPEVGVVGSVGSFFQNPIVCEEIFKNLKETYPEMPSYPNENGVKIPAGWLIDKAGWKGYKENHVGVWDKQALVLVHYGGGKPEEILNLMKKIQNSVKEKFGIEIKPEVNIV